MGYQAQGRGGTKNKDPSSVLEYQQPDLLTPNPSSQINKTIFYCISELRKNAITRHIHKTRERALINNITAKMEKNQRKSWETESRKYLGRNRKDKHWKTGEKTYKN